MVIEFDFEIYKNGDYDKVYLRDGQEPRVLCDKWIIRIRGKSWSCLIFSQGI